MKLDVSAATSAMTDSHDPAPHPADDCRLYQPDANGWVAHLQPGGERQYCYAQAPGQDYFHLIVPGELFVQKGDEQLCLMCALRMMSRR